MQDICLYRKEGKVSCRSYQENYCYGCFRQVEWNSWLTDALPFWDTDLHFKFSNEWYLNLATMCSFVFV